MKVLNLLFGALLLAILCIPSIAYSEDAAETAPEPAPQAVEEEVTQTPAQTPTPPIFIEPDILDLKKIQEEEQLSDKSKLKRVYIFLAVLNGNNTYDTYVASSSLDKDDDGTRILEEPNDLSEYEALNKQLPRQLEIVSDQHICYIADMPHFKRLFPDEHNPLSDTMVQVPTEAKPENNNRLVGRKSIPLFNNITGTVGIERFVAFYNKKEDDEEKKGIITSYGFIAIQIEDRFRED